MARQKIGLVLSGGGLRGLSHISVIEKLQKDNIPFCCVAGTSIGALIGAVYCAGKLKAFRQDLLKMTRAQLALYFDPVFSRTGLLKGEKVIDLLKRYIPENTRIEDLKIPLAITATDYYTGETIIFRNGNLLAAVRASISIPGVFVPVKHENTILIDGGVHDPLPIAAAKEMGADRIIAVNLFPPPKLKKTRKEKKPAMTKLEKHTSELKENLTNLVSEKLRGTPYEEKVLTWLNHNKPQKQMKAKPKSEGLPNMIEILIQTALIGQHMIARRTLELHKPDVLIEPNLLHMSALDISYLHEAYKEGFNAYKKKRQEIKTLLKHLEHR